MILPLLSPLSSLAAPPTLASQPSSHCTKTFGRATPVGPACHHGRLSTQALICRAEENRAAWLWRVQWSDTLKKGAVYGHASIKLAAARRLFEHVRDCGAGRRRPWWRVLGFEVRCLTLRGSLFYSHALRVKSS